MMKEELKNSDPTETIGSLIPKEMSGFLDYLQVSGQFLTGTLDGYKLTSAFQPIFSLAHKRAVGYEALVRPFDMLGQAVSPSKLFMTDKPLDNLVRLDELTRFLHMYNFRVLGDRKNWLFLNISPLTIKDKGGEEGSFREIIDHLGIPAQRIVIEVVEQPSLHNAELEKIVRNFKDLGCLIAIDDFGTGHSNFNRIWSLQPDIVKLDRSFLLQASESTRVRNVISGIVALLHQNGSLVLIEGVENEDQAMIAIESDADFVQGFFFAKPNSVFDWEIPKFNRFQDLFDQYKIASSREERSFQDEIHQYRHLFSVCIEQLKKGVTLEQATKDLLARPHFVRSYLIGKNGIQIGQTHVTPNYIDSHDGRFAPLEDADSADWFRRHYLKRAILHPNQLQVTRPYLSITGAHMCITLSILFSGTNGECVLCCDLISGRNPSI